MAEFIITTTDSAYSYDLSNISSGSRTAKIKFKLENNNRTSNTQGFMKKVQKGKNRVSATVDIDVSQSNYENVLTPMLVYPTNVQVTFDRNIPLKNTTIGVFIFEDMTLVRELPDEIYGVKLKLTEVTE